ncbi:hypothetical protein GQ53DRAFT_17194 [Thozetella sp. PMI_491]|nr:hypothetical protein GQ53DRAFT_17194 [Thozetella sp. PMI_491]
MGLPLRKKCPRCPRCRRRSRSIYSLAAEPCSTNLGTQHMRAYMRTPADAVGLACLGQLSGTVVLISARVEGSLLAHARGRENAVRVPADQKLALLVGGDFHMRRPLQAKHDAHDNVCFRNFGPSHVPSLRPKLSPLQT